jgi:outer membrane biosynthesis protein TonB
MIRLKRYIRPGLLVSVIGHLGALIVGLALVSADPFHAPPPEAMVVEVVRPDELPRFEGTLSNLHSSGSEIPSPADGKGAVTEAPPPKPRSQLQQQTQQRSTPPREAQEVQAPRPAAPEATQAELVRAEKTEPEKQNQSPEPQSASSPSTQQTPEQPNIADAIAQYVALGGPLGGGFAAPPVNTDQAGYDWTAPFRERVSWCSRRPEEMELGDKVFIRVRVSFNRDGTVASPPRLLVPVPSAKQQALMEMAVDALERCQPFTMLPPEKYKQWKTMVFYVTPLIGHW